MDESTNNAFSRAEGASQVGAPQSSIEDELRAAYEELEAARRKLEELKAKCPPSSAGGDVSGAAGVQQPFDQPTGGQQQHDRRPTGAQGQCAQEQYAQQPFTQQQYAQQQYAQQQYNPYQAYQQPYYSTQVVRTKDHVAAGLLAIFLGSFGVHKFYLGYNSAGFVMLAVTIVGSLLTLGIAAGVMCVIGFIEGIIYLVKSQTDFEQLYVHNKREWF